MTPETPVILMLGAIIGSFLKMVIYRLPAGLPWTGRSQCIHCKHTLTWPSLIPILSYLFLLGKCRFCRSKIPLRYLLVEVAMASLLALFWIQFGPSILFLKASLFASVLLALLCMDLDHYLLPDKLTLPLIIAGPLWHLGHGGFWTSLLAGMVGFGTLSMINFVGKKIYKRDVLGGGDMMLAAAIGTWWGLSLMWISLYVGFLVGGLLAVGLLLLRKKGRRDEMPFGPAMIVGWLIAFAQYDWIIGIFFR
jgi:leader peptidase (prepilin peptidase)/N-methyltransferase